jgi:hypothetical protein
LYNQKTSSFILKIRQSKNKVNKLFQIGIVVLGKIKILFKNTFDIIVQKLYKYSNVLFFRVKGAHINYAKTSCSASEATGRAKDATTRNMPQMRGQGLSQWGQGSLRKLW